MVWEQVIELHAPLERVTLASRDAPLPPLPVFSSPSKDESSQAVLQQEIRQQIQEQGTQITQVLREMARAARAMQEQRRQEVAELQRAAIELAITLAARLLHERIESGTLELDGHLRAMIEQLGGSAPVTLFLHPEDLALLRDRLDSQPLVNEKEGLQLSADPALGRGSCRAEQGDSALLLDLPGQLEEVRRQLLRSLSHAGS